jgi:hypothetical protein
MNAALGGTRAAATDVPDRTSAESSSRLFAFTRAGTHVNDGESEMAKEIWLGRQVNLLLVNETFSFEEKRTPSGHSPIQLGYS